MSAYSNGEALVYVLIWIAVGAAIGLAIAASIIRIDQRNHYGRGNG